jgi:3-dehydroquinate synthase
LTDVVGFAASVYRRGVPFYSVPTTLMGMVDAAIGIKNGVNFNQSKNRLGTFRSPAKVLIDFRFLNNLSDRHISNGLAEVIKLGIIHNKEVFDQLHAISDSSAFANRQDGSLSRLCVSAIETVTNELSGNLTERKLARALDFGHTFSPAIEMRYNQFLHGEAVAIDMHISTEIAASRGLLDPPEHAMILAILEKFNLHRIPIELEPQTLWDSIVERTAHRGGSQNIPLPDKIGSCVFVQDVNLSEVASSVDRVNERVVSGKPRGIVASK